MNKTGEKCTINGNGAKKKNENYFFLWKDNKQSGCMGKSQGILEKGREEVKKQLK